MKKSNLLVNLNLFQNLAICKTLIKPMGYKIPKRVRNDIAKYFSTILLTIFTAILLCGCTSDKAGILFNQYPINEKTIYNHTKTFPVGATIYYIVLMPQKIESRYLFIQVVQKDNEYGMLGYNLIWSKDVRLKDEEVTYYTDYLVLKGH